MTPRHPRRARHLLALLAALLLLAAGCSSDDSGDDTSAGTSPDSAAVATTTEAAAPTTLNVTSTDYAYALDTETVSAGLVEVNQVNEGAENHQVTLIRLQDGQSAPDVAAGLEAEGDHFVADDTYAGGPNNTVAGATGSATVPLTEGEYALICFIPNQDGESHFALGMVAQLEVVPAPESVEAPLPPEADQTVTMSDFAFDQPADFAGQGMVEVVNDGLQVHEWTVSNADNSIGTGLSGIAPGATAYVPIDLAADDYTFICFVTDPATGTAHVGLGMTAEVTVPGG
jgi:uncharacterized cupredoxin-like copper-binding protein